MSDMNTQLYEYYVTSIPNNLIGLARIKKMANLLAEMSAQGWRFVTAFSNEAGKSVFDKDTNFNESIFIFEKATSPQKNIVDEKVGAALQETQNDHAINKHTVSVSGCNVSDPFIPRYATAILDKETLSLSLTVQTKLDTQLRGIQGDLVAYNVFDDKVVVDDVCFYNFSTNNPIICSSEPFPVVLPDKISRGLDRVELIVKRYIDKEGLHLLDNFNIIEIKDGIFEGLEVSKNQSIIDAIQTLQSAGDIIVYIRKIANEKPGLFSEDIIQQLFKLYTLERSSGSNMKTDAIWKLKDYLK